MTPLFPRRFLFCFLDAPLCFLFSRVVVSTGNGGNKQGEHRSSVGDEAFPTEETNQAVVSYIEPLRFLGVSWAVA
jgi:hypothetical protein